MLLFDVLDSLDEFSAWFIALDVLDLLDLFSDLVHSVWLAVGQSFEVIHSVWLAVGQSSSAQCHTAREMLWHAAKPRWLALLACLVFHGLHFLHWSFSWEWPWVPVGARSVQHVGSFEVEAVQGRGGEAAAPVRVEGCH